MAWRALDDSFTYSSPIVLTAAGKKQLIVWTQEAVTSLDPSTDLTPCGDSVFLFTDRGDLIRAQLGPRGYREISRAHLLEPTSPFGDRKCAWTPPAYANRHVFARNDAELVCVSLAAKARQ